MRFYAGSERYLRGYKYYTVSPLDGTTPIGGRSIFVAGIEPRLRLTTRIDWVVFFEIGNVYSTVLPAATQKLLKSVGTGFRYRTPVGPLRFDIAFPLDRRPGIDSAFQIYFSVGHGF